MMSNLLLFLGRPSDGATGFLLCVHSWSKAFRDLASPLNSKYWNYKIKSKMLMLYKYTGIRKGNLIKPVQFDHNGARYYLKCGYVHSNRNSFIHEIDWFTKFQKT